MRLRWAYDADGARDLLSFPPAARICPAAAGAILASHRSVEIGHRIQLDALGKQPLFDLDLRLGEGTGAALAMPMVDAAVRILREMASFEDAGVSGAER